MSSFRRVVSGWLFVALIAIIGLMSATGAQAGQTMIFRNSIGEAGKAPGQFSKPRAVAADEKGNIWVADTGNNRVEEFNNEGKYLTQFGSLGSANGQFNAPAGIYAYKNEIWVSDTGNNRVEEFNNEGKYLGQFSATLKAPTAITVSGETIWVADTGDNRIVTFNLVNKTAKTTYPGYSEPDGVAPIANGAIFLDSGHNLAYLRTTERLTHFGEAGTGPGKFDHPEGVARDAEGHLWIVESLTNRIQEFKESGVYVSQFGTLGTGKQEFTNPGGIAVDPGGTLWVADTGNSKIKEWTPFNITTGTSEPYTFEGYMELSGELEPHGLESQVYFEYGPTTAYGERSPAVGKNIRSREYIGRYIETTTLKGGVYHYRMVATNASGTFYGEDKTFDATDTFISSPRPAYTDHESEQVEFHANAPGATFECTLDQVTTPCTSPYKLPEHLSEGSHNFYVTAVSSDGTADQKSAGWQFNTSAYPTSAAEKMAYPKAGEKRASYYTLEAEWSTEVQWITAVTFQMEASNWGSFRTVPAECVLDASGNHVSWPLQITSGWHTEPVYLNVRTCPALSPMLWPSEEVKFRAVVDAETGRLGAATAPVSTEFVERYDEDRVPSDEKESIGPGTVDLLTGAFSVNKTDVSIPVPGTEATLEFGRTYDSTAQTTVITPSEKLGQRSEVLGEDWQPSAPAEAEGSGLAWVSIEEQIVPGKPAVTEKECWNEEDETVPCGSGCPVGSCEEWVIEPAQPEERWMELIDNEGSAVTFEIVGESYVAPTYAKELSLQKAGAEELILADSAGTRTVFSRTGEHLFLPKSVSFQTTPTSVRMVYQPHSGALRLSEMIAPAPAGLTCNESTITTPGCRTLVFSYLPLTHWGGSYPAGAERLASISYYNAHGSSQVVAEYNYLSTGELREEWDPRISPRLPELYTYPYSPNLLGTITPPGQEPWEMTYYPGSYPFGKHGRLKTVSRASLLSSPKRATTSVVYNVPVSGSGAPYELSPSSVAQWGQGDYPVDATAIYPPTQIPHEVFTLEKTIGTAAETALGHPYALAAEPYAGNVWVADTENNRIVEFNKEGAYLKQITSWTASTVQTFNHPKGIAVGENRVYVSDTGNNRIVVFSSTGTYLETIGSGGTGAKQFQSPTGISVSGGYIWVSDTGNKRVEVLQTNGAYVSVLTGFKEPVGIAARIGGEAIVADATTDQVNFLALRSNYIHTVGKAIGGVGSEEGKLNDPQGVGLSPEGFWVADTGNNRLEQFNSLGEYAGELGLPGNGESGLSAPTGVAVAGNYIWIADTGHTRIERWNKTPIAAQGFSQATVHYMDPAGREVDRASAAPPGQAGPVISTTEYNLQGDVVRTLSAKNRLAALAAEHPAERSHELDEHSVWNAEGTEMIESWGPLHQVQLKSGEVVQARLHQIDKYDEGYSAEVPNPPAGTPLPALATLETTGAAIAGRSADADQRVMATHYNWKLLEPTEKIVDPSGLNLRTVTVYESGTGLPIETRQPSNPGGGGAGTTKFIYYQATGEGTCQRAPMYAGLLCKVMPAAQASGSGRPELLSKTITAFNVLDQPTEVVEVPGSNIQQSRSLTMTYDQSGRALTKQIIGGGTQVSKFGISYEPNTGLATGEHFICEANCTGFDEQATTDTYDLDGRLKQYEDADGNITAVTYDLNGRPTQIVDGKGTQTLRYDENSGVLANLEVSGVGNFAGAYDADGDLIREEMPNGLTKATSFNSADEAVGLTYSKASSCGSSCTWFQEALQPDADGQIVANTNTFGTESYKYDAANRIVETAEIPNGSGCTTRSYTYDADSNRLTKTTRSASIGGACPTSGGTTQSYEYDAADRLMGEAIAYDSFGRITGLPPADSGGSALGTTYYSNNVVSSQAQGGKTNAYELDASQRQRARVQTGGLEGVEILHYDGPSDSVSWTERGSTWSRTVSGLGGGLDAIQESPGATTYEIANLQGDVVATASPSPTATELLSKDSYDEFGDPISGSPGRFGWLGSQRRRTELPSGVVQMGARSYIPALGRFLTPDPIPGGSANTYDYANQNPINESDLGGTCARKRGKLVSCGGGGGGGALRCTKGPLPCGHTPKPRPPTTVPPKGLPHVPRTPHNPTGPEFQPQPPHPHSPPSQGGGNPCESGTFSRCGAVPCSLTKGGCSGGQHGPDGGDTCVFGTSVLCPDSGDPIPGGEE